VSPWDRLARWIWLGPLAFALHDSEEIVTLGPWARLHRSELPPFARVLADITTAEFTMAVLLILLGYLAAAWHGIPTVRSGGRPLPFLIASGMLAANGVTHVGQALYFGGYVPGVATATLITIPYGWALMTVLARNGIATRATFGAMVLLGMVLQIPLAMLALAAATR
jgi:hypothetical protein